MTSKLPCTKLALSLVVAAVIASAVARGEESESIVTRTFRLRHQAASEAFDFVHPLLTEQGAVELRPGENALVIRDVPETVEQALELLTEFDLPEPPLRFDVRFVRAGPGGPEGGSDGAEGLSSSLVERLRELLRFEHFELLSSAGLAASEGQHLESWVGAEFQVRFQVGVVQADRRVKLDGFQVARRQQVGDPEVLIHTNLSLWLDKPTILGLARTESSDQALMVVIHCTSERPQGGPSLVGEQN